MKRADTSVRDPARNKRADAAQTRAVKGAARPRKRLGKPYDGRTRQAKAWRRHFERAMAETGGRSPELCKQLASLLCQREALDTAIAAGKEVDPLTLCKLSSAAIRTMSKLKLGLDEMPAEDGTQAAIAALRSQHASASP